MLKMLIDNEEVVSNNSFTIKEEMLSASSTILNNTYPKTWETDHDYTSRFYYPKDYSKMVLTNETYYPHIDGTIIEGTNFQINADTTLEDSYYFKGDTTQDGTPTPDTPIPIDVVTGNQEVQVCQENLFSSEMELGTLGNSSGLPSNETNAIRTKNFIPVQGNTTYTIKNDKGYSNYIYYYRKDRSFISYTSSLDNPRTITTPNATYYIKVRTVASRIENDLTAKYIMVKGNSVGEYKPYNGNTYEINLGKNLWGTFSFTSSSSNVDFTLNTDGTIYANGTASATCNSMSTTQARNNNIFLTLEPGNYYLSGGISSSKRLQVLDDIGNGLAVDQGNGASFSLTSKTKVFIRAYITSGTSIDDTFKVQLERGASSTTYSPYFNPIELCKIGTYQDFIRKGTGSNLLDSLVQGVINTSTGEFEANPNTEYRVSENYIKVDSNKVGISYLTSGTKQIVLFEYKSDYTYITYQVVSNNSNLFTLNSETKYIKIRIRGAGVETTDISNAMVNDGTLETIYEPYNCYYWYLYKAIGKIILTGDNSEGWALAATYTNNIRYNSANVKPGKTTPLISNYFLEGTGGTDTTNIDTNGTTGQLMITIPKTIASTVADFKTWLGTHNTNVYYQLETPTCTEITNQDLINQLESITLLNGLNNIAITSANLSAIMNLHYNYQTEHTTSDLIFSGIVKNTNNISLNPREPKYCSLEILDYKTLLSEGDTLDYVISNKTIIEAITMVVNSVSSYGFELGNINILNGNDIIGAYSTENKTAYDVLQYLADISGAKWNCRRKDDTTMYIDFYDPTLMPRGKQIEYTNQWGEENNLVDIKFNYGTRDYRNKQIIISDEVVGDIDYIENLVGDSVNTSFLLGNNVASITSIIVNGENKTVATETDKTIGIYADFYYKPGSNEITSNSVIPSGTIIKVTYKPVIKGREVITNDDEITRLSNQLEVNGIIARYESRNDETDSNKLLAIGETYLRYKGEAEITLTIQLKDNDLYNVGQMVYFNAPIQELSRDYLVKSKQMLYYVDGDTRNIFYTYTLSSSFNAEREVNWFDNQRNKTTGNIEEGDFISRNIDISSTANIIWDNVTITEINDITGNNELNATLNAPLNE